MHNNQKYIEYSSKYGKVFALFVILSKVIRRAVNCAYLSFLRKTTQLNEYAIVFSSSPDYSDNSKALSDYLINQGYAKKYKIYWLVDDVKKHVNLYGKNEVEFIPRKTRILKELSFKTIRVLMTSKYILSTHSNRIPKRQGKEGQKYIYLWHGCGYKDNSKQVNGDDLFDFCLVPGPIFAKTKARFWNTSENKFLPIGYPRYDWLKRPGTKAKQLYEMLKGSDKKVVIWMPTYRNVRFRNFRENSITQYPLMSDMQDWLKIDKVCADNQIRLLLKLHPIQKMYDIDFSVLKNIQIVAQDSFTKHHVEMYEFIALTDGLISDYSSIAIDYLIVDKPMAFTLDDYQQYKEKRGFVFDNPIDYMPGHHLYNIQDLIAFLQDISAGNDLYKSKRKDMLELAIRHSDCYCRDIVEELGFAK